MTEKQSMAERFGYVSPFGERSLFAKKKEPDVYMLQIKVTKEPKNFNDEISFELITNLPQGEMLTVFFMDNDWPKDDTELFKTQIIIAKQNTHTYKLDEGMQIKAFKDTEFETAEFYILITNPKIVDVISKTINVAKWDFEPERIPSLIKAAKFTPTWMRIRKDAEHIAKRNFKEEEINDLTATIIGESGHGALVLEQQMAIAWTYYNRLSSNQWINKSFDACLTGYSYAYKQPDTKKPTSDVMVVMTALGNKKYANENSGVGSLTVQQLVNLKNDGTIQIQKYIEKGKILKPEIIKQFAIPQNDPYPGYTNQGYWGDLCKSIILRSDDDSVRDKKRNRKIGDLKDKVLSKDIMWVLPMLYFYLQKEKK
jgi:hypothetical protein